MKFLLPKPLAILFLVFIKVTAGFCDPTPACLLTSENICGPSNSFATVVDQTQAHIQDLVPSMSTIEELNAYYSTAYTPERIEKIQRVLEEVKVSAKNILSTKSHSKFTSQLLAAIDQTEIRVDPPHMDQGEKDSETLPRAMTRLSALNANTASDHRISVGGLILLTDESPDLLFQVLAHEMGHVVGPTFLFLKESCQPYDSDYDFNVGLQCVTDKVRTPGFGCFLKEADELGKIPAYQRKADQLRKLVSSWQTNPFLALQAPISVGCQLGQSEESFADLFSAEILSTRILNEKAPLKALQKYLGFFCHEYRRQASEFFTPIGPYPQMSVRIDRILLSNEALRSALKASSPECLPASAAGTCHL